MKTVLTADEIKLRDAAAHGCISAALRRAARAAGGMYDGALRPAGLRGTQFSLLVALSIMGEPAMGALGEILSLDRTTLTRNLAPLERRGLIASAPGSDRRTRIVRLTEDGTAALARALPLWEGAQAKLAAALGEEVTTRLRSDLTRAHTAAQEG